MKLLFIADIHIKLGQKNVPIPWAINRFNMFVEQVSDMQNIADLVVLGGDIFDRFPTNMDEIALYFDLVSVFTKPTIIYSGNHEAMKRNTTFLSPLYETTKGFNPNVIILDDFETYMGIDFIPYNKLKEPYPDSLQSKIVCTHVRGEIAPHVKPEIDLNVFDRWDVVLAGDLHSYDNCQRNILYPGSPYTTSFHRSLVETGAILLDTDTLEHEWLTFDLPQLLKVTVGVDDPKPATTYHHTIYEIEGNLEELSRLEDSELIDKKIVKRSQDTLLILTPEMRIEEELKEYLFYIMQLPEDVVSTITEEFNNHSDKLEL